MYLAFSISFIFGMLCALDSYFTWAFFLIDNFFQVAWLYFTHCYVAFRECRSSNPIRYHQKWMNKKGPSRIPCGTPMVHCYFIRCDMITSLQVLRGTNLIGRTWLEWIIIFITKHTYVIDKLEIMNIYFRYNRVNIQ